MPRSKELDQIVVRRDKLRRLRSSGIDPYPARCLRSSTIAELLANFSPGSKKPEHLVGRLRSLRLHGGSCFAHLEDGTGRLQIYLKRDVLGDQYQQWLAALDVGDFIQVTGEPMRTHRGEPTLLVSSLRLLAKSLHPLPEKWHGLSDVEIRYRRRELDLLANPAIRVIFQKRASLIRSLRTFLDDRGFLEVETPVLQPIAGGTIARPFRTHHEALDDTFALRIAPELFLKRLIVGGFERIYEIGRCFRNEGIDHLHNPEFTMAELYVAYADYAWLMEFTEQLVTSIVTAVNGSLNVHATVGDVHFTTPYQRLSYSAAIEKATGLAAGASEEEFRRWALRHQINSPPTAGRGKILDGIFKALVLPTLIQPTFLTDHPLALSPLAKQHPDNAETVERFQLIAGGLELVNAYSELNDPDEQRRRFLITEAERKRGDAEAHPYDPDFLEALETGLPPTAGWGMGIDRMTMLLTHSAAIKDVLLFPTLKPKRRPSETYG